MPYHSGEFKYRFDFHGDIARQRHCADGAAGADAVVLTKDFGHQFAEAVDNGRLIEKVGSAIHETEGFHDPFHTIKTAEGIAQRGQDCQPNLASGSLAGRFIEIGAERPRSACDPASMDHGQKYRPDCR